MSDNSDNIVNDDASGAVWNKTETLLLFALKQAGYSHKDVADLMTKTSLVKRIYNENVIKKKWNSTSWDEFTQHIKQEEENSEFEDEKQRIIEETIANQERLIKREKARTDIIVENIKSSIYRLPKPKIDRLIYTPSSNPEYTPEHVGLMLSDSHIGASYTMADTGGLGEYNLEIFKERVKKLKHGVIEIIERHKHIYETPHLHVFCLGDIVAGMNNAGEWSPVYINLSIYDQMLEGMAALRDLLVCWSQVFPKITFYGVIGNHGRVSPRGEEKVSTNWDRIVYDFLKVSLENYTNITWKIPQTWWMQEKIQNHSFYLSHGDGIRGNMGIPYYGVERSAGKITGMLSRKGEAPDYSLIGHFHSSSEINTNFGKVFINGGWLGGDMYSLRDLQKCDRPEQKIFGIHPKKGITWTYNIHLGEENL